MARTAASEEKDLIRVDTGPTFRQEVNLDEYIGEDTWRGRPRYFCKLGDCRFDSLNRDRVIQHLNRVHRIQTHVNMSEADFKAATQIEEVPNGEANADQDNAPAAGGRGNRGDDDGGKRD